MAYQKRRGLGGLGASRAAVATMCRPGEILTRDGCEPSGAIPDLEPTPECPTGQFYDAPTDMCQPMPCPSGYIRASSGECVPVACPEGYIRDPRTGDCHRDYTPPPIEPSTIDEPVDLTATSTPPPSEDPATVTPGGSGDGGGGWPWPTFTETGGPESPPAWEDPAGFQTAPESDEPGFGLVSAGLGLLVAFVIGRSFRDMKEAR